MTETLPMDPSDVDRVLKAFGLKLQALYGTENVTMSGEYDQATLTYKLRLDVRRNGDGGWLFETPWDGVSPLGSELDQLRTKLENALIRFAIAT